jgi:hypothetical protein
MDVCGVGIKLQSEIVATELRVPDPAIKAFMISASMERVAVEQLF